MRDPARRSTPAADPGLRQRAEEMLRTSRTDVAGMSTENIQRLIYELQVHQIELELQNEELRVAQQELADSRDRYSDLYEFAPVGYITVDAQGTIHKANLTICNVLAIDRQQLVGRKLSDFISAESQDAWYLHRHALIERDESQRCELTLHKPDHSSCIVQLESRAMATHPQAASRSGVECFRSALIDITQQKHAEEWIVLAQRLQSMVEHLPAGAVFVEQDRLEMNGAAERVTGYSRAELATKQLWFAKLFGEEGSQVMREHEAERRAGFSESCTWTIYRKDGRQRIVDVACHGFEGREVWLLHDITEQKLAEQDLEREKSLLESVVCSVPDALMLANLQREISFCNPGAERIFGYTAEDLLIGQSAGVLYADPSEFTRQGKLRYHSDAPQSFAPVEVTFRRKSGETFVGEMVGTIIRDKEHSPLCFLTLVRDISQRKRLEAEQRRHSRVLEALSAGADLDALLELIVCLTQEACAGMQGAILLLDEQSQRLKLGYATDLPVPFKLEQELKPGDGTCGCALAAATGKRVIVAEISSHPCWHAHRQQASAARLHSSWSEPVLSPQQKILGAFTMYFREARKPNEDDLRLLEHSAQLAGIAIERARTDLRIKTSEERMVLALRATRDAVWDLNLSDGSVWRNEAYREQFGDFSRPSTVQEWRDRIHPEDRERVIKSFEAFMAGAGDAERWTAEYRLRRANGSYAFVVDRALCACNQKRQPTRVIGTLADMTERRALEKEILEIAAAEHRRIGNDLHDGVGQELTGLSMLTDTLLTALSRKELPELSIAQKLDAGIQRTLGQVRALARGMNPVDVDAHGLMSALAEMSSHLMNLYSVQCRFQCDEPVLFRDNQTATQLLRIAQEATTNAIKHGKAKQIVITLLRTAHEIELRIVDNGRGMSEDVDSASGMGLRIMGYRAGIIGGQLQIRPATEGGIEVICSLPASTLTTRVERLPANERLDAHQPDKKQ